MGFGRKADQEGLAELSKDLALLCMMWEVIGGF